MSGFWVFTDGGTRTITESVNLLERRRKKKKKKCRTILWVYRVCRVW